jgi:hypothetical protein
MTAEVGILDLVPEILANLTQQLSHKDLGRLLLIGDSRLTALLGI